LVEYDDVANQQREIVYKLRRKVLTAKSVKEEVVQKLEEQMGVVVTEAWPEMESKPDWERLVVGLTESVPLDEHSREEIRKKLERVSDKEKLVEALKLIVRDVHKARERQVGEEIMRQIEKYAYLGAIDHLWIDHIDHIDGLREGVTLRAYGQRDPLVEFKNEAFELFERLLARIDEELTRRVFRIGVAVPKSEIPLAQARMNVDERDQMGLAEETAEETAELGEPAFASKPAEATRQLSGAAEGSRRQANAGQAGRKKIGRNDPCWCGSGKKWKKCHYPEEG